MDKQKQIEEMAKVKIGAILEKVNMGDGYANIDSLADEIYHIAIPENAVVVPDMADKDFYAVEKAEWDKMVQGAKDIIREKEEKARKETAEKFAPLRKYMWDRFHHYHDIRNKAEADYKKCKDENRKAILNNDYHRADAIMFILGKVLIEFDEICKEIKEGKA